MTALKYRPEIDGLRAVAVLSVIFFHAGMNFFGINPFKGGYVGVDVFFVISGYLITGIILADIAENKFSFLKFYERRARRILPALFLVIFSSIPFAWFWLFPDPYKEFSRGLAAVSVFVSNIEFWRESAAYFAESNDLKPLLHTWSLSVEEQFYVLFPLGLFIYVKYLRRFLPIAFCIAIIISFDRSYRMSLVDSQASFYLLPSRGWELLVGALIAKLEQDYGRKSHPILSAILPFVGMLCIAYGVAMLDEARSSAIYIAIPVLGTALILWFAGNDFFSRLLSSKTLVGIGLISYSLYLWHQPVFAFARTYLFDPPDNSTYALLIVLCLLLAYLSWKYVETPFRNRTLISTKVIWILAVLCSALLFAFGYAGNKMEGLPWRLSTVGLKAMTVSRQWDRIKQDDKTCFSRPPSNACHFNGVASHPNWLFLGDSHVETMLPAFVPILDERKDNYTIMTSTGCPYIIGKFEFDTEKDNKCSEINEERLRIIKELPPQIIVIGGREVTYLGGKKFDNREDGKPIPFLIPVGKDLSEDERIDFVKDAFTQSIKNLLAMGHKIVLVYPVPEYGIHIPRRMMKLAIRRQEPDISETYSTFKERSANAYEAFDKIGDNPNLVRVYPEKIFCDSFRKDKCVAHNTENLFYVDNSHLSRAGTDLVVKEIFKTVNEKWRNH
jgi:peptidoglycan/LPS O-acetylase OafA/YrhL